MEGRPGAAERARAALARVAPAVAAAARAVRLYGLVALAAALFLGAVLVWPPLPESTPELVVRVLVAALLLVPPGALLLFSAALVAVADLPQRIRDLPGTGRERTEALGRLADEVRRGPRRRFPLVAWRAARLVGSSQEILRPHAPLVALASVKSLALAGLAAAAAALEIAAAAIVALFLLT